MRDVDLEVALGQRSRPMRRLLGVALVGLLVLVTISGVIMTVNPGVPAALGAMLHGTPTLTATIGLGGNIAYYENGAPWGKLTVDGRSIPINATPKSNPLARGRHTLTYQADPFPPLRCTISTPAAASDTCPLDATFASRFGRPTYGARAVDLGSTIERLPAAQRDALIALVRSQVEYTSPVTTVRPGEHYRGITGGKGLGTSETAMQPLNATIQIRLANAGADNATGNDPTLECTLVCLPQSNTDQTDYPNLLEVWAHVKMGYHYTAQDGSIVLDYAPLRQIQQTAWRPDDLISLYIGWNGAWQVTRSPQDRTTLPCQYGGGDLFPSAGVYSYTLTGTRPAPNPTDGCLFVVRQQGEPTSGAPNLGPPILFLDRFGVLLAVDDAAHQLLPDVTVASQREADEANEIAAQGPLP